jgi:hypothetical protein
MAFYGGHFILCVKINPPTYKSDVPWARKKGKKTTKNNTVNYSKKIVKVSKIFSAMARFFITPTGTVLLK